MAAEKWEADLQLAQRLADEVAVLSLSYFGRPVAGWKKADGSLATEADVAVERALRGWLRVERPGDAVLGEEEGQTGTGGRRWIIDAIDGTVDFVDGRPEWSTLIALESADRVVVGVCDQPARKQRHWAARGHGAWCTDPSGGRRALRVSQTPETSAARCYVPPAKWLPDERARRAADAVASATMPCAETDHPALMVACGDCDAAIFFIAGPWDIAAPALVVEEAGGRFSDLGGREDLFSGTALFSNGCVHDHMLRVVAGAWRPANE